MSEHRNSAASAAAVDPDELEGLPVPATAEAAPHPRRMLDRYEIIAEIAKGGMGTVFLARLSGAGGFERLMALKVMHDHLAEDESFVTMLLDEARTAAHIHHPNAVGITDVVESPLGYYLVMDYVDGFPLSHIVTHPEMTERERIQLGTRLIVDAANGLHAAHTARNAKGEKLGIVHRDVSPQNVLVGRDGSGRIVDFGIALAASRVASSRPGTLKGKPQYMAPEQARGEPCDARTDVFALGIMLWEVLTYERLFYGEMDVAVLVQVMECNVPSPRERNPNVPEALAQVALKALSRLPKDRHASARDFGQALEKAATDAGLFATTAETESVIERLFSDELTARDEAVRAHMDRSIGGALPLKRGELALVSKLFEKKRAPKIREMHTRTGDMAKPSPASGVRSRGSLEIDVVGPTATVPSAAPPAAVPRTGPSMQLVVLAVLGALGILSIGAYALTSALSEREAAAAVPSAPVEASSDPVVIDPALGDPATLHPATGDPAPVVDEASAAASPEIAPVIEPAAVEPIATVNDSTPATASEGTSSRRRRPEAGDRDGAGSGGTAPTEPPSEPATPPSTGGTPTIEANPYLGH